MPLSLQSLTGFILLFVFAWVISEKRHAINWRTVFGAILLQAALVLAAVQFPWFRKRRRR